MARSRDVGPDLQDVRVAEPRRSHEHGEGRASSSRTNAVPPPGACEALRLRVLRAWLGLRFPRRRHRRRLRLRLRHRCGIAHGSSSRLPASLHSRHSEGKLGRALEGVEAWLRLRAIHEASRRCPLRGADRRSRPGLGGAWDEPGRGSRSSRPSPNAEPEGPRHTPPASLSATRPTRRDLFTPAPPTATSQATTGPTSSTS